MVKKSGITHTVNRLGNYVCSFIFFRSLCKKIELKYTKMLTINTHNCQIPDFPEVSSIYGVFLHILRSSLLTNIILKVKMKNCLKTLSQLANKYKSMETNITLGQFLFVDSPLTGFVLVKQHAVTTVFAMVWHVQNP